MKKTLLYSRGISAQKKQSYIPKISREDDNINENLEISFFPHHHSTHRLSLYFLSLILLLFT